MQEAIDKSPVKEKLKLETVRSALRYRPVATKKVRDQTKLGKELELFLVNLIIAFSVHLMGMTRHMLRGLAAMMVPSEAPFSARWCKRFMKRHKAQIKERSGKKSHKRKVLMSAYETIKEWCERQEGVVKKEAWRAGLVFNIDETKALPSALRQKLLCATNLTENQYQLIQDSTLYSMVSCIAADGSTLFVLYIFRKVQSKTFVDQPIYTPIEVFMPKTRSNDAYPIYYATTYKGYMNGELWKEALKIFIERVGLRQGLGRHLPALLYVDGCSSHLKSFTPDHLEQYNITTSWFPSNTSHIVQPADGPYFAAYKNALQEAVAQANIVELLQGDSLQRNSLLCSMEACREASKPGIVKASFEKRGIFPFDQVKIMANAWAAIGTERSMDADQALLHNLLTDVMFNKLKAYFGTTKATEKRFISKVNRVHTADQLPTTPAPKQPRAKRAAKAAAAIVVPPDESDDTSDDEILSEESDDVFLSDDEDVFDWGLEVPQPRLPPTAADLAPTRCPGCGLDKESRHLIVMCTVCNDFRLCTYCRVNGKGLAEHFKETECGSADRPKRARRAQK